MSKMRRVAIALVTSAGLIGAGLPTTAQERSRLDVASVKPNKSSALLDAVVIDRAEPLIPD